MRGASDIQVKTGVSPRTCLASAADGPGTTLVVDLRNRPACSRHESVAELVRCRQKLMVGDSRLGTKTIGLIGCTSDSLDLVFVQGVGDDIDALSEVCLNSAVAAVEVACTRWDLVLSNGLVIVRMGDFTIELERAVA